MKQGHTLLELAVVLSLLGLLVLVGVGSARGRLHALGVQVAREEVAGVLREARSAARVHGGARVVVEAGGRVELLVRADSVIRRYDPAVHGVRVVPRSARTRVELVYGPSGLGRATSMTLDFERGGVSRPLVVSSYGRVRRDP
ncbi:MAG: prepilin-type N-terminal cleavage/methylation domain-containing protein [Gemmatimonadales bacterium]|nr:MAG: prepilin-type N-terminal cleavage/methylation domain-containing protein [Gemmatimonadales bacterium]